MLTIQISDSEDLSDCNVVQSFVFYLHWWCQFWRTIREFKRCTKYCCEGLRPTAWWHLVHQDRVLGIITRRPFLRVYVKSRLKLHLNVWLFLFFARHLMYANMHKWELRERRCFPRPIGNTYLALYIMTSKALIFHSSEISNVALLSICFSLFR